MRASGAVAVLALAALSPAVARQPAAEPPLPPRDRTPQLVVRHAGPHAPVTRLAFGPDGTLYAGGFGKLVHRYVPAGGKYVPAEPLRVPLGPGNAGAVNAVAVSPDGKWVAVAGRAPIRGETWAGPDDGLEHETVRLPAQLKRDLGVVYLFNPADPRGGKVVRGPESGVRSVAFATPAPAAGPVLVTAGVEWDADGKKGGVVRAYDAATGAELDTLTNLPDRPVAPGLAAWAAGGKLRVAVAWPPAKADEPGSLFVWDVTGKKVEAFPDGLTNVALALRTGPDGAARELISGGVVAPAGRLAVRPVANPAADRPQPLTGDPQRLYVPLAVAPVGDATAVLAQVAPPPPGTTGRAVELRLVGVDGTTKGRVALQGVSADGLPSLAASADSKSVAVAGFADDRIEVYDAAALAAGRAAPQVLAGAPGGFARVAFLTGNRLWLGGPGGAADPPRGGTVFDLAARKAAPGGDRLDVDVAPGGGPLPWRYDPKADTATVTVGGREVALPLRKDEVPTAAALLPAGPAWDKALGPVVAVAHYHRTDAVALVTLFDAATGRRLLQLGGPALRVTGLAFSGSRPLLAAVGADRTVAVWSLRSLAAPFAAIEGLTLVERDGKLVVAGVSATSPTRDALKAGDVVEAVGGEKGDLRAVATYHDYLLAVRALPVGGTARVRAAGRAAAAVPVGRGVGHRHPLFQVWLDPAANAAGGHDWIGWTPAGPYDANSPAAEARLGWLTATGDPAEPVVYAGADQYRRLYYKTGFLRFLADAADFDAALRQYVAAVPRTPPVLTVAAAGTEDRDGVRLLRARPGGLDVQLDDPDDVVRLDDAVLRWRATAPDGQPGGWQAVPFRDGRAALDLAGRAWPRGAHRFEVELRETPELPPVVTAAATFQYVPSAPAVVVRVNDAPAEPGAALTSEKDTVTVAADVTAAPGEAVVVTAATTGPGGERAVPLPAGKGGRFGPVTLKLHPDAKTTVRVTARNAGAGAGGLAALEAHAADLTVWHATPAPRPVPRVTLAVTSPVDAPAGPDRPFVSDSPKVRLAATVAAVGPATVEWDDGDGKWAAGAAPAAGAAATREVTIAAGGVPRVLRVRVTAGGVARTDAVSVVWAALPDADFDPPPATVRDPALLASGPVRPAAGGGPFAVRVVVDSPDAGRREFDVRTGKAGTWEGDVHLAPGDNRLGLIVQNEWKRVLLGGRAVRYVRPPVVTRVEPVQARGADVGDVVATVVAPVGLPPDRLTLDGRTPPVRVVRGPAVLGVAYWRVTAEAVPLATAAGLPTEVRVSAHNADGDGDAVLVPVIPKPPAPPPPPPPVIQVAAGPGAVAVEDEGNLRTDEAEFAFGLRVTSAAKLTRVEVRRPGAAAGQPDRVPNVSADGAVEAGGTVTLAAAAAVPLREGVNAFEVSASNGSGTTELRFTVSYTPPPVRVVIDELAEARPDGTFQPLDRPAGGRVGAKTGLLRVRGRVVFSDPAAAARGVGYDVVLHANDVRHPPVKVDPAPAGRAVLEFVAPVFLNARTTAVRVEVARRHRADPLPQQLADARVEVESANPVRAQRLHVLVIAPEEPEARAGAMAREVVAALNGEVVGNPAGFTDGLFRHKAFVRATLYRPLVSAVDRPLILGRLHEVEERIRGLAAEPGATAFVNDVVLVYYQGRDMVGRDGARRVHTTLSLTRLGRRADPAEVEKAAVRLDDLPPTSGVRFVVLNVVGADTDSPPQRVTTGPLHLRYAWQDREALPELLDLYRVAIGTRPTVGTVVDWVRDAIEKQEERRRRGPPTDNLTPTVRQRPIGVGVTARP